LVRKLHLAQHEHRALLRRQHLDQRQVAERDRLLARRLGVGPAIRRGQLVE